MAPSPPAGSPALLLFPTELEQSRFADQGGIEPGYALRALCMFRLVHPRTDLRIAGGREVVLRSLGVMALWPANSLFTQGYLTTVGATPAADHQMILDAGFTLELPDGSELVPDPAAVAAVPAPRKPSLLPVVQ